MITTPDPDDPQGLPHSAERVLQFYTAHAADIFPPVRNIARKVWKKTKKLFRGPKYKPKELDKVLKNHCLDRKLSGAHTAVIIPSFDIKRQQPVFFSSWKPGLNAALLTDVCRATTAAPTFLPPVDFTVPATEGKKKKKKDKKKDQTKKGPQTQAVGEIPQFNMIDGGMAVNNPVGFSSGGKPGLFSLTFYQYESFLKTYLSIHYHNLGRPAWF
jgi:patatin-like phospholipase/acyl hydrolase